MAGHQPGRTAGRHVETVRFDNGGRSESRSSYFDGDGKTMRAAFLRAPLAFRRIVPVDQAEGTAARDEFYLNVADDTLQYVMRQMTDEGGGFYSAEEADSVPPERASDQSEAA